MKVPIAYPTSHHFGALFLLLATLAWAEDANPPFRALEGHTSSVMSLAFSPDGKSLATSSRDKTIRLWNVQSGRLDRALAEHTADVYAVRFSPRGDVLASGSGDATVRLWDRQSGKVLRLL